MRKWQNRECVLGALMDETSRNPHPIRRAYALAVLTLAKEHLKVSKEVEQRAAE